MYHNTTQVEYVPRKHVTTVIQSWDYFNKGEDSRKGLVVLMGRLVDKMLKDRENDSRENCLVPYLIL